MANFPNSVTNYVTRNPGDVIPSADFDSFGAEITAIETGLINGTAPINTSRVTAASLQVAGNSTLVGTLQVNGNSTISGNLVLGGTLTASSATFTVDSQPRVKVTKGSTQSVTNATWTALTYDGEDYDAQGLHSTSANPSRINCTSTGVWLFGATVGSTVNSQSGFLSFRKNGNTFVGTRVKFAGNSSLTDLYHLTTIDVIASSGDYMECVVFQNSGASMEFGTVSSSRVDQPEFWAVKLW